jgi:autotransporter-associated beta strand protein
MSNTISRFAGVLVLSLAALAFGWAGPAGAGTVYTWDHGGAFTGSKNWSSDLSWAGDVLPTFAATDTLNLSTVNITGSSICLLDAGTGNITLGIINIGDTGTTSNTWAINRSGAQIFNMDNSGGGAQVNMVSTSKGDTISVPLVLLDNLTISNAAATNLFTLSGGITSTGTQNLILSAGSSGGITLSTTAVNNTGTITNNGTGTGTTTIATVGSNVTSLTESSTTSALTVTTLNVGGGGTALNNTLGTKLLTVTNSVAGTGNLILNNNSALAGGITLTGGANNTGSITNSGTNSTGTTIITGVIGTNVNGGVIQNGAGTLAINGLNTFTSGLTVTKGIVSSSQTGATGFGNGAISLGNTAGGNSDAATLLCTGSSLLMANPITVNAGSSGTLAIKGQTNSQTFSGTIALNNDLTLANLTAAKTTTFSNTITGSSTLNIGNTGITNAGTVALTGSNNGAFTGNTVVNGGTLNFGSGGLGNGSGTITLAGGTLQYAAAANTDDVGTRLRTSGANALKIDVNNNAVVFASPLTDASLTQGLTLTSTTAGGSLTLTGANTYSGTTTISAGTLIPATAASLPGYDSASKVVFSGGTVQVLVGSGWSTGDITTLLSNAVKTSGALGIDTTEGNLAQWTSFNILGAVGLTKLGTNTLTLNQANTYTGATTVKQGTLQINDLLALQNSALDTSGAGAVTLGAGAGSYTFGGLNGSADLVSVITTGLADMTTLVLNPQSGTATYSGAIANGAMAVTKTGAGTQVLSGANTYAGATNIAEGTLTISNAATFTNTSAINLSGTGRLTVSAANSSLAKLASPTGTGVPTGTFLQYSTAQTTAGASNGPGTIFGTVELDLTNVNPNYTLDFGAGSILTNTKATVYTSPITLSGDATINATSGAFTGTGMTVGSTTAGAKTLTLTGTQTSSITGAISDGSGGGTIGLTKSGAGIWKLSGANTYTGPTNNTEHVLEYDNFSAIGNTSKITTTSSGSIYFNNGILNGQTITTPMEISGAHSYTFAQNTTGNAALIIWDGPTVTFNNTITLLASSAIHFFSGSLTANFNGTIGGTGDMTFSIGGAAQNHNVYVVLNSGSSLTYSGNTIVTTFGNGNATVKLNGGYLPSTLLHLKDNYYSSTFNNTAVFDLNGKSQTLSGLTDTAEAGGGGRFVVNTSGTQSILTIDGTTSQTFAGVIGVNSAASAHGQTAGAGDIALVKAGSGTQTLSGANTYTGATTINGGTLLINGAAGTIKTSTAINLNGGGITLTNATGEIAVDRVKDDAPITSNGGTITWTNASGNSIVYAETVGSVALTSGQLNLVESTAQAGTGTSSQTLTIGTGGITHTDSTNTSAVTFSAASTGPQASGSKNMIVVTGGGTTNASEIIGPWATVGTTAALQTDYAIYTSNYVTGCGTAATTSDSTWSTTYAATSNYNFANGTTGTTLTATRNINTLLHTGGAETLTVATGANLGTYGILNGVANTLTIEATDSGAVTLPTTSADKLYVTTGSGAITISAPIQNNGDGALTLVKSGSGGTLTLSGNNTYTGGTVVNAGTIAAGSTTAFGTNAAMTLANFAGTVLNITGYNNSIGSLTGGGVNGGNVTLGAATLTVGGDGTSPAAYAGVISGTGALTKTGAGTLTLSGKNTYTGSTTVNEGTLTLADNAQLKFVIGANGVNNKITGDGTVDLFGDFNFNLSGAVATAGNQWQIVDVSTLSETFESTFSVTSTLGDFTPVGSDKWTMAIPASENIYQFDKTTGKLKVVGGMVPGDTNTDGVVDAADYIAVKQNLGLGFGATLAQGNLDDDGDVDWDDLQIVMTNFGNGASTTPATTPEPATLGLLAIGAMAVLRRRRK